MAGRVKACVVGVAVLARACSGTGAFFGTIVILTLELASHNGGMVDGMATFEGLVCGRGTRALSVDMAMGSLWASTRIVFPDVPLAGQIVIVFFFALDGCAPGPAVMV